MKPKPISIIRACMPFFVAAAHMIGCTPLEPLPLEPEPTPLEPEPTLHELTGDLIMVGQDVGATTASLYRFSADGTKGKKIDPGPVYRYELSANRTRIVVLRSDSAPGQPTLYFLDTDGGNTASLTFADPSGYGRRFAISPTGHYVAYGVGQDNLSPAIYVARTDGSAAQMVIPEGQFNDWVWSPVEDKLAAGGYGPLFIYDAEAKTLVEATSPGSHLPGGSLHVYWSPDGNRLAFSEGVPDNYVLATVGSHGKDRRDHLTHLKLPMSFLSSWSPNSQYFAMWQYQSWEVPAYIHLVDVAGTMHRELVGTNEIRAYGWTPTGHFVYMENDGSLKSTTLAGQTVDLAGPNSLVGATLGPNGRLMTLRTNTYLKTINADDGSNPISYPAPESAAMSDDGTVIAIAGEADANGAVPVYAAASNKPQTTVVLTTTKSNAAIWVSWYPIVRSSGIVFQPENDPSGWIRPTNNGFQATYPQLPVTKLGKAYEIEASAF